MRPSLPDCPPSGPAEAAAFGGAVLTTCATRSENAPQHQRECIARPGYYDDDESDHAVVYFGGPISSGYVLIRRDHLVNVTTWERERWTRAHPEVCWKMGLSKDKPGR